MSLWDCEIRLKTFTNSKSKLYLTIKSVIMHETVNKQVLSKKRLPSSFSGKLMDFRLSGILLQDIIQQERIYFIRLPGFSHIIDRMGKPHIESSNSNTIIIHKKQLITTFILIRMLRENVQPTILYLK